ncbi:hypothetical protein C2E20_6629 [Micractinium conductrix]|uniref:Uncharacterized protein n=1 Tax=Micractinium conductrix TaxID=554055 RepID=A0A2P6V6Z7_9CHLO|nr:hypothetical protein C2E20_6629 [Micractinium conductrix]|eukprot:PSC69866.1 hypothetical protein C2E20_6629 [Micractinium conductrix]
MYGRSDLGVWGAIKAAPVALALAGAAKAIVDRGLHKRRWVRAAIVVGGAVMLWVSRLLFARPKPSPLDPMFSKLKQERIAALAEQRRAAGAAAAADQQRQRQGHLLKQPDAEHGRALLEAQEQAAKQQAAAAAQRRIQ